MRGAIFLDENTVAVQVDTLKSIISRAVEKQVKQALKDFKEELEDQDKMLTKQEAIKLLKICTSTFDNWDKNKRLKVHRIEGSVYVFMSDIKAAAKANFTTPRECSK